MRSIWILAFIGIVVCLPGNLFCQVTDTVAVRILLDVDKVLYAAPNRVIEAWVETSDKYNTTAIAKVSIKEKQPAKRLIQYIEPPDMKGVGILCLPGDTLYYYTPVVGKPRLIASSIRGSRFAGTDLIYEDLETRAYSEKWNPVLLKNDSLYFFLTLTPKPGIKTSYLKLNMTVKKENGYPARIDYFGVTGQQTKTQTSTNLKAVDQYWYPGEITMEDFKDNHKTRIIYKTVNYDQDTPDSCFTPQYLGR